MKGAVAVPTIDPQQYAKICADNAQLREERDALKQELDWFKRQLFGRKSEKRLVEQADQLDLGQLLGDAASPSKPEPTEKISYTRRKEYARAIAEAKRPDTVTRRLKKIIKELEIASSA